MKITKRYLQKTIYEWVRENFGESEANDPSWNIGLLAQRLAEKLKQADKKNEILYNP